MRVLDLFSGIGGFSLGLERAGMRTVAFCEIDPYCRAVLKKHWPEVPAHDDIRRLRGGDFDVDLVCGGFPCQDISAAGKGRGIEGERSGLWREMARIVAECRPRWVFVENVPMLRVRGADRVLADLEGSGYACWPLVVGAVHAGAPHRRQRVWIVAYAERDGRQQGAEDLRPGQSVASNSGENVAHRARLLEGRPEQRAERQRVGTGGEPLNAADTRCRELRHQSGRRSWSDGSGQAIAGNAGAHRPMADGDGGGLGDARWGEAARHGQRERTAGQSDWWLAEPDVGRVAHGVPARVDRLRALGNAVVPQVVEIIGRAIMEIEHAQAPRHQEDR